MALDIIARGLAATEIARQKRLRILNTLRASIAKTDFAAPTLAATLPTIGAPTSSSAIASGTTWQVATGGNPLHAAKYTFLGGAWQCPNAIFPNTEFYKSTTSRVGNGTDPLLYPQQGPGSRVRFVCAAPSFELYVQMSAAGVGGGFRLKVDGKLAYAGVLGASGNGLLRYIPITWGSGGAADRKDRHYELEFASVGAFVGIRTTALYKPHPWVQGDALRVLLHGDSMLATIVDAANIDTALHGAQGALVGDLLGQADTWSSGVGGSGWMAPAVHDRSWFNERVDTDVIANAPDVIIETGGGNDAAVNPAQATIQPLIETWLTRVLAAKPETAIFMTGPIIGSNAGASHLAIHAAKQAAAAKFPQNVAFIDTLGDPWVSGTGRDGTPTGDGNRDWVTGTDSAHPTVEGHRHFAGRIARSVARAIPGLIAAQG
ncbi:MAG TPA: SGNH/GDSL hydrolase family protein [Novosphingobium sp.]|nr:SGNH/GDSL hydrolase family protein [Novosphingobium sp.]